jgi:hypothetical protein
MRPEEQKHIADLVLDVYCKGGERGHLKGTAQQSVANDLGMKKSAVARAFRSEMRRRRKAAGDANRPRAEAKENGEGARLLASQNRPLRIRHTPKDGMGSEAKTQA